MNEAEQLLVNALRSGKYKQARKKLRDGDSYCCLGVACDLFSKQKNIDWDYYDDGTYEFLGSEDVLPSPVRKWLGWGSHNGSVVTGEYRYVPLSELNDDWNLNFNQIANIIESGDVEHE